MLEQMTQDNALLAAIYPLSEALRGLWTEKSREQADRRISQLRLLLLAIARQFDFPPARRFASILKRRCAGIINAGRLGFTA